MKTLLTAAKEIVTNLIRNPRYTDLNDTQREQLTAAAIQGMQPADKRIGNVEIGNPEAIDDVVISKAFINKLIEALQEQNIADKHALYKEMGEMIAKSAIEHCKKDVTDALDDAVLHLAKARHFYEDSYEAQRMSAEDNAKRAHDMQLAMRG